jgi:sporulation protein YlmC with PRC-barrel domain
MRNNTQKEKKIFLSWLDDDNIKRNTYVYEINRTEATITFKTKDNIITIPFNRILKIKENIEGY